MAIDSIYYDIDTKRDTFFISTEYAKLDVGSKFSFPLDSISFKSKLFSANPIISIESQPLELTLTLTVSPINNDSVFYEGLIPIKSIEFLHQESSTGEIITSLAGSGIIIYPNFQDIKPVKFQPPDLLILDRLDFFYIKQISLSQDGYGIKIALDGVAGDLSSGVPGLMKDYRLTQFDKIWRNHNLIIFFTTLASTFSATVGVYRTYKELKS